MPPERREIRRARQAGRALAAPLLVAAIATAGEGIVSASPSDCGCCMPGGPESYVEVVAKMPLKYTLDPIVLRGRREVK